MLKGNAKGKFIKLTPQITKLTEVIFEASFGGQNNYAITGSPPVKSKITYTYS